MSNKKVLLIVAHEGYQSAEYTVPKEALEAVGFMVVTASDKPGVAIASDGSTTAIDLVLEAVRPFEYEGIFFIGGPGAMTYLDNEISYGLIRKVAEAHQVLGAICIAPRILAKAGVLKGRQATGWNDDGGLVAVFQEHGVHYVLEDVVVDDLLVTASGPRVATIFAQEIITLLQSNKESK